MFFLVSGAVGIAVARSLAPPPRREDLGHADPLFDAAPRHLIGPHPSKLFAPAHNRLVLFPKKL